MHKILILTCGLLIMSSVAMAEGETAVETCAGGAGTILTGKSGYKYCRSNKTMNWWNAYVWCDALGKRMFDLNMDCGCNSLTSCRSSCPEMVGNETDIWTMNSVDETRFYFVYAGSIIANTGNGDRSNGGMLRALCY